MVTEAETVTMWPYAKEHWSEEKMKEIEESPPWPLEAAQVLLTP